MIGRDLFSTKTEGGRRMFGGAKIKIDKDLLEKVKKYAASAGYASPEEFVQHVLEREIAKFEEGGDRRGRDPQAHAGAGLHL